MALRTSNSEQDACVVIHIEFRHFVGMSLEETAASLSPSNPTIIYEARPAPAWPRREIGGR
jgi:hypothetical protein